MKLYRYMFISAYLRLHSHWLFWNCHSLFERNAWHYNFSDGVMLLSVKIMVLGIEYL